MIDDPIVEEMRAHRKAFAEAHGNDLMRIAEALRQREKASNAPRVRFEPKVAAIAVKTSISTNEFRKSATA